MVFEFKFPDVGEGIREGKLVKWMIKEGDKVKEDQPLAEVETDKAVVELPSPRTGTILKLGAKEGETIKVGEVLVTIGEEGEKVETVEKKEEKDEKPEQVEETGEGKKEAGHYSASVVGVLPEAKEESGKGKSAPSQVKATPVVRKIAKELGVDIETIKGTGPKGRVTEQDVRNTKGGVASPSSTPAQPASKAVAGKSTLEAPKITFDSYGRVLKIPVSTIRRTISNKMKESRYTAPHSTAMGEIDITALNDVRKKEQENAEKEGVHLTFLPFIIRGVVYALKKNPYMNASLDEANGIITNKQYYNIGIAVDTAAGLMVPVIKNADQKSIVGLGHDIEDLANKARTRKIKIDEMKGGTFTITNYGSIGANYGVPIINYPEVGIIGLGRGEDKPVVREGKIVIRKMLPVSISYDHRVVDGAKAVRFLSDLKKVLEDPNLLLVEME